MTQAELAAKIDVLTAQVVKIEAEVSNVKQALADAIANGNTVTPELAAAVDNLGSSLQIVDDLNPDA